MTNTQTKCLHRRRLLETGLDLDRSAAMKFSQESPRVIEAHLKEKVLLLYPSSLGKTAVLPILSMAAPLS